MVSTLSLISLVFLIASHVGASNVSRRTLYELFPRQASTSDFPSQCPTCTTVYNNIDACATTSCMCTSNNADLMQSCLNCLISLDPTTDVVDQSESTLNTFESECQADGIAIPSLSLSTAGLSTATADSGGEPTSFGFVSLTTGAGGSLSAVQTTIAAFSTDGVTSATAHVATTAAGSSNPLAKSGAVDYKGASFSVMVLTSLAFGMAMVF